MTRAALSVISIIVVPWSAGPQSPVPVLPFPVLDRRPHRGDRVRRHRPLVVGQIQRVGQLAGVEGPRRRGQRRADDPIGGEAGAGNRRAAAEHLEARVRRPARRRRRRCTCKRVIVPGVEAADHRRCRRAGRPRASSPARGSCAAAPEDLGGVADGAVVMPASPPPATAPAAAPPAPRRGRPRSPPRLRSCPRPRPKRTAPHDSAAPRPERLHHVRRLAAARRARRPDEAATSSASPVISASPSTPAKLTCRLCGRRARHRAVHGHRLDAALQRRQQAVAQRRHARPLGRQLAGADSSAAAPKPTMPGHVQRAGTQSALLAAAGEERRQLDPRRAPHVERADALRPVHLVRGDRDQVGAGRFDVERHLTDRLHGVGVQPHAARPAGPGEGGERLEHADLVVGRHHRRQHRLVGERRREAIRIDQAVAFHRQHRHAAALVARAAGRCRAPRGARWPR